MSKRAAIRERRKRERIRRRLTVVMIIVGAALIVTALMILPSLRPEAEIIVPAFRPRALADGRAMGDPDAPVLIEIFEDFQCPACRRFSLDVEPQIEETYIETGVVRYVFLHYPFLDDRVAGNESNQSANASMCAAEQGMFWEYHDIVFANWNGENQGAYSDNRLIGFGEKIGLDTKAFEECFESEHNLEQIQKDFEDGLLRGITGTPAVFVNGVQIAPGFVPSFEQVRQAVEQALAESQAN